MRERFEDGTGNRRCEQRVAGGDDPYGIDELFGWRVLEKKAARAGLKAFEHVVVAFEGGEDHDPASDRGVLHDSTSGFQSVELGHLDVHENHIGTALANDGHGLVAEAPTP